MWLTSNIHRSSTAPGAGLVLLDEVLSVDVADVDDSFVSAPAAGPFARRLGWL